MSELDEFGRQKIEPLEHPRDLLTEEEQAELDEALRNMAEQRSRSRFEAQFIWLG